MVAKTHLLCQQARFDELFMGNEFSELPLLRPRLWRQWDYPVMQAFCATAAAYGRVTHCHQHGSVRAILADIARTGLNVLCPLEAAPGGDVELAQVKREYGDALCLKGNVSTNLLLNGTPEEVREAGAPAWRLGNPVAVSSSAQAIRWPATRPLPISRLLSRLALPTEHTNRTSTS